MVWGRSHGAPWQDFRAHALVIALDTIIAATAEANDCIVVTDNERDFSGVECINPLRGTPS